MKIAVIHGQLHKGITYTTTQAVLGQLMKKEDELKEFFLVKDGPDFCYGCNNCFLKGEEHCPSASHVQPIVQAIEWADVIILDTPNYVMNMSGAMKNMMDHLAYRWWSHRPYGPMFRKIGIVICSSAGVPPNGVLKLLKTQMKYWGIPKVYKLGLISNAMGVKDLKAEKKEEINRKAINIAKRVKKSLVRPPFGLESRVFFTIFRRMQLSETAAWNPKDREWWKQHGWLEDKRPWKR